MGDQYEFGLHNNSAVNLERGLMERVFYVKNPARVADSDPEFVPTPQPLPGHFRRLNKYRKDIVRSVGRRGPISHEMFLAYYTGPKLATYTKAVESLSERAVCPRDAHLKTFVKAEKLNLTKKPDPCPRVIQPRDPRYNVEIGCYLKHIEHPIYKAIDRLWGSKTIFKGMSVEAMGNEIHKKMRRFPRPCAIGFDASRFDQHVSVEALKFEHSIYNKIHGYPERLQTLLKWQIHNTGSAYASDGYFKYSVDGCRMSGDMNTSLGNCILAALISKELVDSLGIEAELVNNGDDNVLICPADDEEVVKARLYDHFLAYGFEVVAEEPKYITEQVEFCQMQPVFDGHQYVMVRNPTVSMSKDSHSITPFYSATSMRKWIRAVGECGLSLTGGIPIKQEYYKCYIRNGMDKSNIHKSKEFASGFYNLSQLSSRREQPVRPEARYSFYLAFGYTPDEQVAIENYFSTLVLQADFSVSGTPAKTPACLLLQLIPTQPSTSSPANPKTASRRTEQLGSTSEQDSQGAPTTRPSPGTIAPLPTS